MRGKVKCANTNQKKAGAAIWFANGADFRRGKIIRSKKGHSTVIKESSFHKDLTTLNVLYSSNNKVSSYLRQKLIELKRKI